MEEAKLERDLRRSLYMTIKASVLNELLCKHIKRRSIIEVLASAIEQSCAVSKLGMRSGQSEHRIRVKPARHAVSCEARQADV